MALHCKTKGTDGTLSQLKCIQINLQHSRIATANLMKRLKRTIRTLFLFKSHTHFIIK